MKRLVVLGMGILFIGGYFFYTWIDSAYYERREVSGGEFIVEEGESVVSTAKRLKEEEFISNSWVLLWGAWKNKTYTTIRAGKYSMPKNLSPYEIVQIFTEKENEIKQVKVTFPEGWTVRRMADRLNEKELPGESFYALAMRPSDNIQESYDFLSTLPENTSLEGYLFPDTYFFSEESSPEFIVQKMLDAFEKKVMKRFGQDIDQHKRTLHEIVTMASIVETEVRSQEDRNKVSDIFWSRLNDDFPLQSDATLEYVLQKNALQHNAKDLQVDSPYNTYRYKGLPPGPVAQPSLTSIQATLFPQETAYYYFLSDPQTGETLFARTFEEHKRNKIKVGL